MKEDDLTIGLYGINGVYNYGCEAIVRGTENILREKWPDINIKYASIRPKDDKKRLVGTDISIVERKQYSLISTQMISKFLAYSVGLPFNLPYNENIEWIDECDAILSIGGDIYTLPPNYKDRNIFYFLKYIKNLNDLPPNYNKLFKPYHWLVHFGETAMEKNKKFVVWGASVGPFEKSIYAKKLFIDHLNRVNLITVRDYLTRRYLENEGIYKNVQICADPAFSITSNLTKNSNKNLTIGINLSPLSSLYVYGKENNIIKQSEIISNIIRHFDADVILLPHVICDFDLNDDDLRYLSAIKSNLPEDVYDRVILIKDDPGFLEIKKSIIKCDLVLASRMHCAINALSLGIPVIFLGYSEKSLGMCNYIYGNNKWVMSLKELYSPEFMRKIKSAISQIDHLNSYLEKTKRKWIQDSYKSLNSLTDILCHVP